MNVAGEAWYYLSQMETRCTNDQLRRLVRMHGGDDIGQTTLLLPPIGEELVATTGMVKGKHVVVFPIIVNGRLEMRHYVVKVENDSSVEITRLD